MAAETTIDAPFALPVVLTHPAEKVSWRPTWWKEVGFLGMHVGALAGAIYVGATWRTVLFAVWAYFFRMFFITAGYHRYFAHRSYKTSRAFQLLLAVFGMTAGQKGPIWWASHHRHHHKYSDMPEDTHSPVQHGFFWAHMGWIMSPRFKATRWDLMRDFERYPELRFLNRFWVFPQFIALAAVWLVLGFPYAVWGGLVSTIFLWHGTFTINSLSHIFGSRRYETTDTSKNNPYLALITMGEGWHNNHHHYQSSAAQGFRWYELDLSFEILRVLSWLGIVWDLRLPPARVASEVIEAEEVKSNSH
jgi:stearoyl-CoA desaturase (delta-9 desaturase)